MSVKLREKQLKDGNLSLYLDIYHKGRRSYEFLDIRIVKPARTPIERQSNKDAKQTANNIRANREAELQSGAHDHVPAFKRKANFIAFAESVADEKRPTSRKAYHLIIKKVRAFAESDTVTFGEINKQWCERFYIFLLEELASNTAYDYLNKFSHFLAKAVKKEIIASNPAEKVERKKRTDRDRCYLTFEELQKMIVVKCDHEGVRRAFLFSCLTGLRWSDVSALRWGDIKHSEASGHYLAYQQIKTQSYEHLPVSEQAIQVLGEPGQPGKRIFTFAHSNMIGKHLKIWALRAGIDKPIHFHSARHTFATLQLSHGTDIAVVSKLLGHKDISTTQIYARVIDQRKRAAVDAIPSLNMKGGGNG